MRKEIISRFILRISIVLAVFFMFNSCKKEFSLEKGGYGGIAQGQLVDSLGNCKSPTVVGDYKVDTPISYFTNYIISIGYKKICGASFKNWSRFFKRVD